MFTGIVLGLAKVTEVEKKPGLVRCTIELKPEWAENLLKGASIAIDGVCLTVEKLAGTRVSVSIIEETLEKTTLKELSAGACVNVERAAKIGDEIGGHLLSGHIVGTATIQSIEYPPNNTIVTLVAPKKWMRYLLPKGFVALDGVSLTLVDVDPEGTFSVHLIPETLRTTTLGVKLVGAAVNLEIDSQTQAVVDTVTSFLSKT